MVGSKVAKVCSIVVSIILPGSVLIYVCTAIETRSAACIISPAVQPFTKIWNTQTSSLPGTLQ